MGNFSNLLALCENVLEPLRQWYDKPITISSGYRCRELNSHTAIGGSSRSQHMTGEAADLHIPDTATGIRWFAWIRDNCDYDQLICERATPHASTFWIHVSYSRTRNRKQVITDMIKRQLPNLVCSSPTSVCKCRIPMLQTPNNC